MAARKTLIDQMRQEVAANGGSSLLLSGGDINTGVPESDLQDAEPDFLGMSDIGYDAMAVGNHEFDNPLSVLEKQRVWANFPMLAANIYDKNGDRYFKPYKIFELGDLRVAVVGMTTEDTAKIGNPEFISDLTFTKPTEEMPKVIAEIKETYKDDPVDFIFATTHMGHYENVPARFKCTWRCSDGESSRRRTACSYLRWSLAKPCLYGTRWFRIR